MRMFLAALLLWPVTASAGETCYSLSDCAGAEHCSTLDTGITPGTCVTAAPVVEKVLPKPLPVPAPAVQKPAPVSSSAKSSLASSPSSSSVNSSSSSAALTEEQQGILSKMFASMMESMKSLYNGLVSTLNSALHSIKCIFGCSE